MNPAPSIERRERLLMLCLMVAACLTLAHFVHEAWFAREAAFLSGKETAGDANFRYAPDAYRIAMPLLVPRLQHLLGFSSPSVVSSLLDFATGLGALLLLYLLVIDELPRHPQRFVAGIAFLALIQFPFAWVVPHQRPETMPSALYLALALFAVSRKTRLGLWFAVLLVATFLQSFMRTDVPGVLGFALVGLASFSGRQSPSAKRGLSIAQGASIAAIAIGVQWYLQTVRFPHLSYPPDTPAFQLLYNFRPHNLLAALLALIPCLLPLALLRHARFRPVEILALTAATLYLPLWFLAGITAEVRIFVPFLLPICMVSARGLAQTFASANES